MSFGVRVLFQSVFQTLRRTCLKMWALIIIFLQGLLAASSDKITIFQAPYQAQIISASTGEFIAHATILNCKWAVTIASAVNNLKPKDIKIRSGSGQVRENGGVHAVRDIVPHTSFDPKNSFKDNIALIQLWFNYKLSRSVCQATLSNTTVEYSSDVGIVGWWQKTKGSQIEYNNLPESVVYFQDCYEAYNKKLSVKIDTAVICTLAVPRNPAGLGNSLNYHEKLQGLLIYEGQDLPSAYTDISAYIAWINDVLKIKTHYNDGKQKCEGDRRFCIATFKNHLTVL